VHAVEVAEFEVWRDNWPTLHVFLGMATQWRWLVGMRSAQRVGLDYPALEVVMRLQGVKRRDRADMFNDVQAMERAALEVFNSDV
jgi:hypothetical protein